MLTMILTRLLSNPVTLVAAAAPFVGKMLQDHSAQLQAEAEHRHAEQEKARAINNNVSNAMDKLAYLNKEAMFAIVFRGSERPEKDLRLTQEEDRQTWKEYRQALNDWEEAKIRYIAETTQYFGEAIAKRLEAIQDDFDELAHQVAAAFYKRKDSKYYIEDQEGTQNDFRSKYFPVRERVLKNMKKISVQMLQCIQTERVGSLRP